jgi:XTP/dITP diphosphohydrolase
VDLLLASNNKGKIKEIKALLQDLPIKIQVPSKIGLHLDIEETGSTYKENASLKAAAFAEASGLVSLADDSGLEVHILGGAPGLYSARFSPLSNADDADRRWFLLKTLAGTGYPSPWKARFHCTVAIAHPSGPIQFAEGSCEGEIIPEERGEGGFGYDPIFFVPEYGKTMSELEMEEKNRISHRARAINAARPILLTMLKGPG